MTRILLIHGHPSESGVTGRLARAYSEAALAAGAEVESLWLGGLAFDPILREGFRRPQELEPDLQRAQELLQWAEHLVLVFPVWWGGWPALLKGFIDRVFLPGFAFKYPPGGGLPVRLMKGRSARVILTSDGPVWWDRLVNRSSALRQMSQATLRFVGYAPVRATRFGLVGRASEDRIAAMEQKVRRIAAQEAG